MDERNSLARSDQKGSLSLSVSLSFRCCPHANVSPRHACQHRFQVRSISRFSSLSFSHPTWQRYIRFVAKILRRVTYFFQLQESFVSFFIGIAYRFAKLIEERVFFSFFHLRSIHFRKWVSNPFFCYFFRVRPQQRRVWTVLCFLARRKWDNHAKIDGGWSKGGERQFWGHNGMKLCLREVVNELWSHSESWLQKR